MASIGSFNANKFRVIMSTKFDELLERSSDAVDSNHFRRIMLHIAQENCQCDDGACKDMRDMLYHTCTPNLQECVMCFECFALSTHYWNHSRCCTDLDCPVPLCKEVYTVVYEVLEGRAFSENGDTYNREENVPQDNMRLRASLNRLREENASSTRDPRRFNALRRLATLNGRPVLVSRHVAGGSSDGLALPPGMNFNEYVRRMYSNSRTNANEMVRRVRRRMTDQPAKTKSGDIELELYDLTTPENRAKYEKMMEEYEKKKTSETFSWGD